jgi:ATP-dependent RNA helicase HelY
VTEAPAPPRPELFVATLPFPLDPFQRDSIEAVDAGGSVLVAAPTGSGKTVVAEFACWLALETGAKCFYTTPLKALSNQKFGDLVALHGARNVGLLTGDNSINGEASLVVMTTEVLRNMLYERSSTLAGLRWVVMDEVHYLQDRYRGAVWEEVLIHLPPEVRVVCLSATVSNVEEFGDWLRTLRGETTVVLETERPVELRNEVMVGQELIPLLDDRHKPNPHLDRMWARGTAAAARTRYQPGRQRSGRGGKRPHTDIYTPTRVEVADVLAKEKLLPAIVFIFSRIGCDEAVDACARAGLQLTTEDESESIREFAEARCVTIEQEDLRALRFGAFMDGLERGIAAHHAGMLPIFKETVEELFALGLVKLAFATETLSLGINMPARSVVIERLSKFTGEKHELLTPIEYTQLTGRAGRRGMDDLGFGITLFSPWVTLDKVAQLATNKAYELTSSFRPSFNMAVNLVRNYDHDTAAHMLNSSFAQFTTDRDVVRWEHDAEQKERSTKELREQLNCPCGDIMEYRSLREQAAEAMSDQRGTQEVRDALAKLVPGDVVWGERLGRAVIVEQAKVSSGGGPRITAMTADRKLRRLGPRDFREPPRPVAKLRLKGQAWRSPKARKGLARELETLKAKRPDAGPRRSEAKRFVDAYESHPCHTCPDIDEHMKFANELADLERDTTRLHRLVRRRKSTISRVFDRVIAVLEDLRYVDGWELTEKGELLTRVYNESDLMVVECLNRGWFAGLDPDELVAVASVFVFEARRRDEPESAPSHELARYERRIANLYKQLHETEAKHEIELLKEPDAGFMAQIYEWSTGATLEEILEDRATSAGDFVRSAKQVIDLLQQLRQIVTTGDLAETLHEAVTRVQRGVVAYSSVV